MNSIEKLTELFRGFPGIGPRQAKRFVYHLLGQQPSYLERFVRLVGDIKREVCVCSSCFRLFNDSGKAALCRICSDDGRDQSVVMVVEKDIDLESMERSRAYNGLYFVLGGTVAILEKEPEKTVRSEELLTHLEKSLKKAGLKEIILAFSVNAEGENTAEYIASILKPLQEKNGFKISTLGRGLSTGSEVEYADSETLRSALKNRL